MCGCKAHQDLSQPCTCSCPEHLFAPKNKGQTSVEPEAKTENVLEEANRLIYGDRRKDYGDCTTSFQRIADLWALVLKTPVSADQVALCLIQLKVARACNDADVAKDIKRDSIVDIAGYAGCLGQMLDERH